MHTMVKGMNFYDTYFNIWVLFTHTVPEMNQGESSESLHHYRIKDNIIQILSILSLIWLFDFTEIKKIS
jgi:hypothetical protein